MIVNSRDVGNVSVNGVSRSQTFMEVYPTQAPMPMPRYYCVGTILPLILDLRLMGLYSDFVDGQFDSKLANKGCASDHHKVAHWHNQRRGRVGNQNGGQDDTASGFVVRVDAALYGVYEMPHKEAAQLWWRFR